MIRMKKGLAEFEFLCIFAALIQGRFLGLTGCVSGFFENAEKWGFDPTINQR